MQFTTVTAKEMLSNMVFVLLYVLWVPDQQMVLLT